jgi:hypothetical protein
LPAASARARRIGLDWIELEKLFQERSFKMPSVEQKTAALKQAIEIAKAYAGSSVMKSIGITQLLEEIYESMVKIMEKIEAEKKK